MTKLILTILLTLSFSTFSATSTKNEFKLKKAKASNSYILNTVNQMSSNNADYGSCMDECDLEFEQCLDSGVNEYYCQYGLDFCEYSCQD